MKSSRTIKMEFQQVLRQTNKLESCAEDLRRLRRELSDLVDDLRCGWAGDSAELYFQKCYELENKLCNSADNLNYTAKVIECSARAYQEAELAAIRLTQN